MGARVMIAALLVAGCGTESAEEPARFHDLVERHRHAPLEERIAVYLPLARSLNYAGKWRHDEPHLSELVDELLRVRDFGALDALEKGLESVDSRLVLIETVSRHDDEAGVQELLGTWARADPEEITLACYRPGGVEFLFAQLEDPSVAPQARARCAHELWRTGGRSLVPRLQRLADDPTPVPTRSLRAGSGTPTLGEIVRDYIERLENTQAE